MGLMDNRDVAILDAAGWREQSRTTVVRFLADLPLVEGIPEVVAWCRENDLAPYLATLAWEPVSRELCERFGFDGSCGPTLVESGGRYTGHVETHFDEFDKRDFAVGVAADLGLTLQSCVSVGDGRSDLPLFAEVGFSVAFNASTAVRAAATTSVAGPDLRAIIPLLTDWLRGRSLRLINA